MPTLPLCLVVGCALAAASGTRLLAAEPKATLSIEDPLLWSGERLYAYVRVKNWHRSLSAPKLQSSAKGVTVRGPFTPTQETKIINDQSFFAMSFPFVITAGKDTAGTFTIGPAIIPRSGGDPLKTNTVQLEVHRKPPQGIRMTCELSQASGPVRWPFRVVYRIYYSGELSREVRRGGFFTFPRRRPFGINGLTLPILNAPDTKVFPFAIDPGTRAQGVSLSSGEDLIVQEGFAKLNGYGYKTLTMGFDVLPMKAREIRIEPAQVQLAVRIGSGRFEREQKFSARTEAQVYTAYPLQANGRPATHSGAVGSFAIEAAADRRTVDAFEPVKLTVTVTPRWPWSPKVSNALLEALQPPLWTQDRQLTQGFDVLEVDSGRVVEGKKIFVQTIRALNASVTEIPPLPFPYYNPATRSYEVARAAAIPLKVRAVKTVTGKDAMRVARSGSSTPEPQAVTAPAILEQAGIGANFSTPGTAQAALDPRAQVLSVSFLSTVLAPPLVFLGVLFVFSRSRRRDPAAIRRSQAHRKARQLLSGSGLSATETNASFQGYFRDRLGLGEGELTPDELERILEERGVSSDLRRQVREFLDQCLAAGFGGGEPASVLAQQAVKLVDLVEKELPKP